MVAKPATGGFCSLEEKGFVISEPTSGAVPEALHLDPAGGAAHLAVLGPITHVRLDTEQLLPGVGLALSVHSGPGHTG